MNWFKLIYALALVFLGGFWFYHLYPIAWTDVLSTLSFDKAAAQKSASYSMFFALAFILYGIYEIKNAFQEK